MLFHVGGRHGWRGIREFVNDTDIPGKGADRCGCVLVGQRSRPCKWADVHLYVLRASDPFLCFESI